MTHSPAPAPSSPLVGYARVSTSGQTLDQQTDALAKAGVSKLFTDTMSGARDDRPGLAALLEYLREGDTVVVWRLDRLGRNTIHVLETVQQLTERGVVIRSLSDGIDSGTAAGRMVIGVLASMAEYERELVRERTALKREHAKAQGVRFGRPNKLSDDQAALARRMKAAGESGATIAATLGISRATLYRYLNEN